MYNSDRDKGKSASNLQKLYSSQILENYTLQKQKSDLDYEKVKKLRQLSNNEQLFLRKYQKYVVPGRRGRRSSIDPELARAIELRNSQRNRLQSQNTERTFSKDTIRDECPYSFETWNRLVDVENSVIDQNKTDILFGDDDSDDKNVDVSDIDTELILEEMARTNVSLLEQGKILRKRQTLKPIETTKDNFDDEAVDEEIREIQFRNKKRGRRHSVALGAIYSGQLNKDSGLKLPSIKESNKLSSSLDFKSLNFNSSKESLLERKLTRNRRKLSMSEDRIDFTIHSPVQENSTNEKDIGCFSQTRETPLSENGVALNESILIQAVNKNKGNVAQKYKRTDESYKLESTPRPVANATIFVQGETNINQNSMFDRNDASDKMPSNDTDEGQSLGFLPKIDASRANTEIEKEKEEEKHVSFEENNTNIERPGSRSSRLTSEWEDKVATRSGRKGSVATAALKLLVDSHHGAAKLRYIAKLAHEMEKEEIAKHPPEPEHDMFKELNNCRYLRVVPRKESTESRENEVS